VKKSNICKTRIPVNFNKYDLLEVLCLQSIIAKAAPIVPPKATKLRSVFSEILLLFFIASRLSYAVTRKARQFMLKKQYNKTFI
jgi:hypothetical protein